MNKSFQRQPTASEDSTNQPDTGAWSTPGAREPSANVSTDSVSDGRQRTANPRSYLKAALFGIFILFLAVIIIAAVISYLL